MSNQLLETTDAATDPSQNALKEGLFAAHDFIRHGERDEFEETRERLLENLTPNGELEFTLADEIIGACWRLRRCRLIEAAIALRADDEFNLSDEDEKRQKSVDRARAQSENRFRRSISELRKIQTERHIRTELEHEPNWGVADYCQVMRSFKIKDVVDKIAAPDPEQEAEAFAAMMDRAIFPPEAFPLTQLSPVVSSFCKTPEPAENPVNPFCKSAPTAQAVSTKIPRNVPCPCRSGLKYKKCCGGPAAPAQNIAA